MAVRVDQLVPYGYTDSRIATFHAFGDTLIREYALDLGLPPDVRVLSRAETVIFLREHLYEFELQHYRPLGDPTRFLGALATLFSRCKDEDISPSAYLQHAERLRLEAEAVGGRGRSARRPGRPPTSRPASASWPVPMPPTSDCWPRTAASTSATRSPSRCACCATRRRSGPRSPGGSGTCSSTSSRTPTGRRRRWSALLAEAHRNVTVVGDDDQAIYAFRGAAVDNILDFEARYPGARTVVLRRNYRSLASDPGRVASAHPVQRPGPSGGPRRDRQAPAPGAPRPGRAGRSAWRRSPPARTRRTGWRPTSGGGWTPGAARATTPCWSGPTGTPTRSSGHSAWPASRGGSPARPVSTAGRRFACCWPSCGPSPIRGRASMSTPWPPPTCTGWAART